MNALEILRKALQTPGAWWTLGANAIPVAGVLVFGWDALPLLIYYWIENVLIGAFNVPKIVIAGLAKSPSQKWLSFALAPFFVVHYGVFCFVHGMFIFAIFTATDLLAGRATPQIESFDVFGNVIAMLRDDSDLRWSVIALVLVLSFRFVWLWLASGEWRNIDPMRQMFEPYGRIVALHLTILIAAIPVVALGQPAIAVLCLAILKTAVELGLPLARTTLPISEEAS